MRSEYDTIIETYIPFSHVNGFRTANPGAVTLENQWPQHNNPEQLTYAFVTDAFPGKQHSTNKNYCRASKEVTEHITTILVNINRCGTEDGNFVYTATAL
jgi:hypothetical protein